MSDNSFCKCANRYSFGPHDKGHALYFARCPHRHGYNIANMTEVDEKRIEWMVAIANMALIRMQDPTRPEDRDTTTAEYWPDPITVEEFMKELSDTKEQFITNMNNIHKGDKRYAEDWMRTYSNWMEAQ